MSKILTTVDFMHRLEFPQESITVLESAQKKLFANGTLNPLFKEAEAAFFHHEKGDFLVSLAAIAEQTDVPRETVDMVFLVSMLPRLLEAYRKNGISEDIFWNTAKDLTYKLVECYVNRGVWGTFVTFWFPEFYRLERFGLGRLQYERKAFPYEGVSNLQKGQTVYNCHIPSAGTLTPDLVEDSLLRAKAFFAQELTSDSMPVYCSSWMLYPPHVELFPKGSNLRSFAERFTVVDAVPDPTNHDFWRIFNRPWDPDMNLNELPEDTSLRRAFKTFLMNGNVMGSGKCILWI